MKTNHANIREREEVKMNQTEKDTLYDEMREQRFADADDRKDCLYDEWKEKRKEMNGKGKKEEVKMEKEYVARMAMNTFCNIAHECNFVMLCLRDVDIRGDMLFDTLSDVKKVEAAYLLGVHGKNLMKLSEELAKMTSNLPDSEKEMAIRMAGFDQKKYYEKHEPMLISAMDDDIQDSIEYHNLLCHIRDEWNERGEEDAESISF